MAARAAAPWLEVDKEGLAAILERRGRQFAVYELIANGWDEEGVTAVSVTVEPLNSRTARLVVEDDAPDGFADLTHAYTLFARSRKAGAASLRGRFNLGEKLVLAICDEAEVVSTNGGVAFDKAGRHSLRRRRERGSRFEAIIRLSRSELSSLDEALLMLLPPATIATTVQGRRLETRTPFARPYAELPTELADDDGRLRPTRRQCGVELHRTVNGERPTIYEMGIPVVEHDGAWHINVGQKVPLNMDRDNVTPAYLRRLRTVMLDAAAGELTRKQAADPWVRDGLPEARPEIVRAVTVKRFGKRAVIFDPSDREANKKALDMGYSVVHGASLSAREWSAVREAGALLPAGRVMPSGVATAPDGVPPIRREEWTVEMVRLAHYAARLGHDVLGFTPAVEFYRIHGGKPGSCSAWWGGRTISFNLARFGLSHQTQESIDALLIHEFAHHAAGDHYSERFYSECCRIGAKARQSEARWTT